MEIRVISIYGLFILLFTVLIMRLAVIINTEEFLPTSSAQGAKVLEIGESRGTIYDRDFKPITNSEGYHVAAVVPCLESQAVLLEQAEDESRALLLASFKSGNPFMTVVEQSKIYSRGIEVFRLNQHFKDNQEAVHVVGYLDGDGKGVSGLEGALEEYLKSSGGRISVRYDSNALGGTLSEGEIIDTGYHSGGGVVTTLDLDIQRIVEKAGEKLEQGAIVVQEVKSGELTAVASFPDFSPNNLGASLEDEGKPFINRAFTPYSVGSTFKTLVAATALESGYPITRNYRCDGFVEIGERKMACHFAQGHGIIEMTYALEQSCNPYFITLATQIGGKNLAYKASLMDFGVSNEFIPGYGTKAGQLPSYEDLTSKTATANLSLGQGDLMATPVHIASLISTIANRGKYNPPRLLKGYTDNGYSYSQHTPIYTSRQVFSPESAKLVADMMVSVVERGSGKYAKPETGGAGGKTASAQSGQIDEEGNEVVQAWFCGFFPANDPRYSIVVLAESGNSGTTAAGPVFKEIADGINQLKK